MRDDGKRDVLGVLIDVVDFDGAVQRIINAARQGQPLKVSALAVHGVMTGVLDRRHRQRLNRFDLITPDGQPVRWALNLIHRTNLAHRVHGPELMLRICKRAADESLPIYLYGSTEEMLTQLKAKLTTRFPGLQVAGSQASRFRSLMADEQREVVERIKTSGARIVFVGLGCPRQELFVHNMTLPLSMPVLAVGAAFAFHSGASQMAPTWMQNNGLEWLHRLTRDPLRLWRRYLLLNPLYVVCIASQWLKLINFRSPDEGNVDAGPVWG